MLKTFDYEKLPIVEVVNEILYDAAKRSASDIHFDPEEEEMIVRIRIDGQLMNYTSIPNTLKSSIRCFNCDSTFTNGSLEPN